MPVPLLTIISGTKATDALICQALEQASFKLRIIHYKIPIRHWLPWIWKRIRARGMGTFIGHLLLAAWLRGERLIERLQKISPWLAALPHVPDWSSVRSPRYWSLSEASVLNICQKTAAVLLLDSFRFSHRFFRAFRGPILQVIWGDPPDYLGDSGGYWAYVHGDTPAVTLVERHEHFNDLTIIEKIPINSGPRETLRTIKIKQALALRTSLPGLMRSVIHHPLHTTTAEKTLGRLFYAPTLFTYVKYPRPPQSLPDYAFRTQPCTLRYKQT